MQYLFRMTKEEIDDMVFAEAREIAEIFAESIVRSIPKVRNLIELYDASKNMQDVYIEGERVIFKPVNE